MDEIAHAEHCAVVAVGVAAAVGVVVDHRAPVPAALESFGFGNSVPERPDLAEVDFGKVEPEISGLGIAARLDPARAVYGVVP